jgi:hypothetical protein
MRCQEVQFKVRSRVMETKGGQALTFGFRLGPVSVFIIANLPEDDNNTKSGPLAYIKLGLRLDNDWEVIDER